MLYTYFAMQAEYSFDWNEALKRLLRYLLEGVAVALAATLVAKKKINGQEVLLIALTASAVLSVLDVLAPAIAASARTGAGYGVGLGVVGSGAFPMPM